MFEISFIMFAFIDFFDSGVKREEITEEKPKTMADILPEGFFDNPKADAKVILFVNIVVVSYTFIIGKLQMFRKDLQLL